MMDYDRIKDLAQTLNCRTADLVALAPKNDPFYVGTPGDLANAEWFASLWYSFGYSTGVHLRRVHYQIISQSPKVTKPDGQPYENTQQCWDFLGMAAKAARYLQMVPADAFDDRRNPDPVINLPVPGTPSIGAYDDLWGEDALRLPDFPDLPRLALYDYTTDQRYHLEIWCEKSTMNDVFIPLCQQYGINLVTGLGELSITTTLQVAQRIEASGKPCRILYVSDFDPAGQCMPVSVGRKLEFFVRQMALDSDIKLFPIVLTADQVREYQLPRTPIKDTEKRKASFEAQFGADAVELDALEALHPGTLASIVTRHIMEYYDEGLQSRTQREINRIYTDMRDVKDDVMTDYDPDDDEGRTFQEHVDSVRERYEALKATVEEEAGELGQELTSLFERIKEALEDRKPDIDDYPKPEGREAECEPEALYDSGRDYMEQLAAYKVHQGGDKLARFDGAV